MAYPVSYIPARRGTSVTSNVPYSGGGYPDTGWPRETPVSHAHVTRGPLYILHVQPALILSRYLGIGYRLKTPLYRGNTPKNAVTPRKYSRLYRYTADILLNTPLHRRHTPEYTVTPPTYS